MIHTNFSPGAGQFTRPQVHKAYGMGWAEGHLQYQRGFCMRCHWPWEIICSQVHKAYNMGWAEGHLWSAEVALPPGTQLEFKVGALCRLIIIRISLMTMLLLSLPSLPLSRLSLIHGLVSAAFA